MKTSELLGQEEWRPIPDWPNYEVSENGQIRNPRGRIVRPWIHYGKGGKYLRVSLYRDGEKKGLRVHRLVAQAFVPNPDNLPEVDHLDDDAFNNHYTNLEWVSGQENIQRRTMTWRERQKQKEEDIY